MPPRAIANFLRKKRILFVPASSYDVRRMISTITIARAVRSKP
jgi:hypothetical protein